MKDEKIMQDLHTCLTSCFDDPLVINFLLKLYRNFQNIDDVYDGDITEKNEIADVCIAGMIEIGGDDFFSYNRKRLAPLIESTYLQWQSANKMEDAGIASEKSYMLRASYYQIVHYCALIIYGRERAVELSMTFQEMYGENYKNYKKEFTDA